MNQKRGLSTFTIVVLALFGTCSVCTVGVVAMAPDVPSAPADVGPNKSVQPSEVDQQEHEKKLRAEQSANPLTVADVKAGIDANEAKFNMQTKDKIMAVSGEVDSIKEDLFGGYFMVLKDPKDPVALVGTVHCKPAEQNSQRVMEVNKGDMLTVTGVGGGVIMGSLMLNECEW